MKCVVPGANIKVLARAIHSLAKIGEDLYIDPSESGLAIRTANGTKSAFVSYSFKTSFFSSYSLISAQNTNHTRNDISTSTQLSKHGNNENINGSGDDSKCRVTMRGIMIAFKSIGQLEKTAESCLIAVCHQLNNLKIRIICKYNVTKTYTIPFIESESLLANYDPNILNNQFSARAKILTEAVLNFLSNQEEVTMIVSPSQFSMKNFVEDNDSNGSKKIVHTQLTMQPAEFEEFQIAKDSNVTYCLKELRSLISFADALNLPVKASFSEGGEPIVFNVHSPLMFEGTLVMATLVDSHNNSPITAKENSSTNLNNSKADGHISTQESLNDSNRIPSVHNIFENQKKSIHNRNAENISETSATYENVSSVTPKAKHPFILSSRTEFNDTNLYSGGRKSKELRENILNNIDDNPDSVNEVSLKRKDIEETNYKTPTQKNRLKAHTPQSKKAKYTFKKTFDATFKPSDVCGTDIILASDSEGDEN